ncbi:aryl-sulfate sulfotransferase [Gillisia sp. CAL575]|uniref:aryl-sulfate sulfotransferase n=1 Tax=Gillisia sp. CAL575 TaxID=985255 RepID=UPI0006855D05|nr:aryl-sulfate sulfotransferase [Gillisia sp. CAL575]
MRIKILIFLVGFGFYSCQSDDDFQPTIVEEEEEEVIVIDTVATDIAGNVIVFKQDKIQDGYVLVNDASNNRVYMMEKKESEILYEWNLPSGIGNDAELLENGNLLVALTVEDPAYTFGGFGGRFAIIAPSGELLWDYTYSNDVNLAHHDVEMLPNGNVLFVAWEKKTEEDLTSIGYTGEFTTVYAEKIIEIDPISNQIVWQWNVWDHLVQDVDNLLDNYGVISDFPEKVNINYEDPLKEGNYNGDIFHANALEYDAANDLIYLSVNYFSEVWVIDHSTTQLEVFTSSGGNYEKGGDLVYRFGNPEAYNNVGERMFFHNHNPNLVPGGNSLLVFSNGLLALDPHSTVYELEIPAKFDLKANKENKLEVKWSFSDPDLFSPKVSGAYRLPNGNTLITQGNFGFWEVTETKEVVWRFEGQGFFWRGYPYQKTSNGIINLGL